MQKHRSRMVMINGRQIRGVIFDIDGTLIDTFSTLTQIVNETTSRFGVQPITQQFLTLSLRRGVDLVKTLRLMFPVETDESVLEGCRTEILQNLLKIERAEVKPFPGIKELFSNIAEKGLRIGIATGRPSMAENEWERFKDFGLEKSIDCIVTSREVARKPAPDAIIQCAQRMKVPVENCLVVGDTEDDVIAARRAGGIPVAILPGEDPLDLSENEQPEFIFENLIEFTLFLDGQESLGRNSAH